MREYPKIETLYSRDVETHRVNPQKLRLQEFALPSRWWITEKINGTNVRIGIDPTNRRVTYTGRTDYAQLPVRLLAWFSLHLPIDRLLMQFTEQETILFGEGYGGNIQNGNTYQPEISFCLFDVLVGSWWLEPDKVQGVATALGIHTVPVLDENLQMLPQTAEDLLGITGKWSRASIFTSVDGSTGKWRAEGIVARTRPLLLDRQGNRVMWKLKFRDFVGWEGV